MGLKEKIFKFMSDILKDGSYYKLFTQAKFTSACGLPKGFFLLSYNIDVLLRKQPQTIVLHTVRLAYIQHMESLC